MTLVERVVALHRSLRAAGVPHAFGGAIALAYRTLDPRGTSDIDVNLFLPAGDAQRGLAGLPDGVKLPDGLAGTIARDGQARVFWDDTPLDLFFSYAPVHADAAEHAELVPFAGTEIPILGAVELAVFKAMFDRTRDWADLEAMAAAGTLDAGAVAAALTPMVGASDARLARLRAVATGLA